LIVEARGEFTVFSTSIWPVILIFRQQGGLFP
jgi:hypothetical protein